MPSTLLVLLLTLALARPSSAWWAVPHMVTAEVARRHLSSSASSRASASLMTLSTWFTDTSSFTPSAVWADDLKSHSFSVFNQWHFVDAPVLSTRAPPPQETLDTLTAKGAFKLLKPHHPPPDNAVWLLKQATHVFADPQATPWARALFLRLVTHAVGDVHQPLHAASYYSQGCVEGDGGGNAVCVLNATDGSLTSLHHVMDGGAGFFDEQPSYDAPGDDRGYRDTWLRTPEGLDWIAGQADRVVAAHPRSDFGDDEVTDFAPWTWANESNTLAAGVYARLEDETGAGLECSPDWCKAHNNLPLAYNVSAAIRADLRAMVVRRVALGGYRLANMVEMLVGKHDPPPGEGEPSCGGSGGGSDLSSRTTQIALVFASLFGTLSAILGGILFVVLRQQRKEATLHGRPAVPFQSLNENEQL